MTAEITADLDTSQPAAGPGDAARPGLAGLDAIFSPRSIAIIGLADRPESLGLSALRNLRAASFGGRLFPVQPGMSQVLGVAAYPTIGAVPGPVDLALIATPAATVPDLITAAGQAGVRGVIVLSPGFRLTDPAEAELAERTRAAARASEVPLIGPGSLGVIRPGVGLNASVLGGMVASGSVGFLSQSQALTASVLDWGRRAGTGFSMVASVGSLLGIGWADWISYLGTDPATRSIVLALETIGDARGLLGAARAVAATKPIIALMPVRTEPRPRLAPTLGGLAADREAVLDAGFRRAGILRVHSIADIGPLAEVLARPIRPAGSRLAIVTNAPDSAALATEVLIGQGGCPATLTPESIAAVAAIQPPTSDDPARFARAVATVACDPGADALLILLAASPGFNRAEVVAAIEPILPTLEKPVLVAASGDDAGSVLAAWKRLGIPTLVYPDTAVRVFAAWARHAANLRDLADTPSWPADLIDPESQQARGDALLERVQAEGRTALDEIESKQWLAALGLAMVATRTAATEDEAVAVATAIGFPVALKVFSRTIASRAEIGGVRLNLLDADAVRAAFWGIEATVNQILGPGQMLGVTVQPMVATGPVELAIASRVDPEFGPVILCGRVGLPGSPPPEPAVALPPLNLILAQRLVERMGMEDAPNHPPIDRRALAEFLVRLSWAILTRPRVATVEMAPVFARAEGLVVLDARVTLHAAAIPAHQLPRPAIRPYPAEQVVPWTAKDGGPVTIRPIRAEDEELLVHFHASLVARPIEFRCARVLRPDQPVERDRLTQICRTDQEQELVLVVDRQEPWTELHELLGVAQLTRIVGTDAAELAVLVQLNHQGRGFATELVRRLLTLARLEGIERIEASISAVNHAMIRVAEKLGFQLDRTPDAAVVAARLDLDSIFDPPAPGMASSPPVPPVDLEPHDSPTSTGSP